MSVCEKCWADACTRMMFVDPFKSQAEHYLELLEERKDNPCEREPREPEAAEGSEG